MVTKNPKDAPVEQAPEAKPEPELVHPESAQAPTYDQQTGAFK